MDGQFVHRYEERFAYYFLQTSVKGNVLTKIFNTIGGKPTVLFTGSGYHVYQPILSVCLEKICRFPDEYYHNFVPILRAEVLANKVKKSQKIDQNKSV